MSYDPSDRFHLDPATADRIADLAERIEVRALGEYHVAECSPTHTSRQCLYSVPVFEVIAELHARGLLTLPPEHGAKGQL